MAKVESFDSRKQGHPTQVQRHNQESSNTGRPTASTKNDEPSHMSGVDIEQALDFFFFHNKGFAVQLLREVGINCNIGWQKDDLRDRVRAAINAKEIALDLMLEKLTEIEGWGNQYLHFFRLPDELLLEWQDQQAKRDYLSASIPEFNEQASTQPYLPDIPTIAEISMSEGLLRCVLIFKRHWKERFSAADRMENDIEMHAFRRKIARGVSFIEIDVNSGLVTLAIPQTKTIREGKRIYRQVCDALEVVVDISTLERVDLSPATSALRDMEDISNRQIQTETTTGSVSKHSSCNRSADVLKDQDIQKALRHLKISEEFGNFYLAANDEIKTNLHFKILPDPSRLGIFGQKLEEEVRLVIDIVRKNISI